MKAKTFKWLLPVAWEKEISRDTSVVSTILYAACSSQLVATLNGLAQR
jgi:hypothetical protein